jgi:hypothetical protein
LESTGFSFHFFADWQNCRRKFFFRRLKNLRQNVQNRRGAQIGTALHSTLESFRTHGDWRTRLWDEFELIDFDEASEKREMYAKCLTWTLSWIQRYGANEIMPEVEQELFYVDPETGMNLSGRLDAVFVTPDLIIEDLKSSSYKDPAAMVQSEMNNDQYCHYAILARENYGPNPLIRLNIAYLKPSMPQAFVSDGFSISVEQQHEYLQGLRFMYWDILDTLKALQNGSLVERVFPRNSSHCSLFGCEYQPICHAFMDKDFFGFYSELTDERILAMNKAAQTL